MAALPSRLPSSIKNSRNPRRRKRSWRKSCVVRTRLLPRQLLYWFSEKKQMRSGWIQRTNDQYLRSRESCQTDQRGRCCRVPFTPSLKISTVSQSARGSLISVIAPTIPVCRLVKSFLLLQTSLCTGPSQLMWPQGQTRSGCGTDLPQRTS